MQPMMTARMIAVKTLVKDNQRSLKEEMEIATCWSKEMTRARML
jgi:hypothetical protein